MLLLYVRPLPFRCCNTDAVIMPFLFRRCYSAVGIILQIYHTHIWTYIFLSYIFMYLPGLIMGLRSKCSRILRVWGDKLFQSIGSLHVLSPSRTSHMHLIFAGKYIVWYTILSDEQMWVRPHSVGASCAVWIFIAEDAPTRCGLTHICTSDKDVHRTMYFPEKFECMCDVREGDSTCKLPIDWKKLIASHPKNLGILWPQPHN